jgi:TonB family protein
VRRKDALVQFLAYAVCGIFWFNPMVWYAAYRLRIERERACDDYVLSLGTDAADYADHLVQIVRSLRARRSALGALQMARASQIESRVVSILDGRARRLSLSKAGMLAASLSAAVLTFSVAAIGVTAAPEPVLQQTRIGDGTVSANSGVTPPKVLRPSLPDYTQEAVAANVEGIVTLEIDVNAEGVVKVLRVVKGLGHGLDQKAIEAVLAWKFGAALRNGAPVQSIAQVDVEFEIPVWYRSQPKVAGVPLGPGLTPPSVLKRVNPEYTPEARAAKYEGKGVFTITVRKDGSVFLVDPIPDMEFGLTPNVIEALEQWKFKPGMRNGEAVAVTLQIEVNFNYMGAAHFDAILQRSR